MSTQPDMKRLDYLFWDKSLRIDKIIWLTSQVCGHCEDFRDLLESEDESKIKALLGLPGDVFEDYKDVDFEDVAGEVVKGRPGFLVQGATPIPTINGHGHTVYSWGWFTSRWFYAEDLGPALIKDLLAWRESVHAKNLKKPARQKKSKAPTKI